MLTDGAYATAIRFGKVLLVSGSDLYSRPAMCLGPEHKRHLSHSHTQCAIYRRDCRAERTAVRSGAFVAIVKTTRDVARDSQGRVYNIFRELVPVSESDPPPIVRIHFYDPQTRSYTYLYPQRKAYVTGTVNHPPAAEPADLLASPVGNSVPLNQFTKQEDLGTESIAGVSAHGVREVQTIPAASSGTGNEIVLTDEYWYSDDLHINVAVKHYDPRTGSVTMTPHSATRGEPDPSLFQIPEDYKPMGIGNKSQSSRTLRTE